MMIIVIVAYFFGPLCTCHRGVATQPAAGAHHPFFVTGSLY